jgi:hypothetical protein
MAGLELCVVPRMAASESPNVSTQKDTGGIISVTAALELNKKFHSKFNNNTKISGPIKASLLGLTGKIALTINSREILSIKMYNFILQFF